MACEPLVGNGVLVAEVDPAARLATIGNAVAGPAGSAGLDVGAGVELDIDVADPRTVVGVTLDFSKGHGLGRLDRDVRRRCEALLGPSRVDCLVSSMSVVGRRTEVMRLSLDAVGEAPSGHNDRRPRGRAGERSPFVGDGDGRAGVSPHLRRAALAYATAGEAGARALVRSLAILEAAVSLSTCPGLPGAYSLARGDIASATDEVLELAEATWLSLRTESSAIAVTELLRAAAAEIGTRSAACTALLALADAVHRGEHTLKTTTSDGSTPEADHGGDQRSGSALGTAHRRIRVDVRSIPGSLAWASPVARRVAEAEVEVRVLGSAATLDGVWARGFQVSNDVLVALAPFRAEGGDHVARLLVPPACVRNLEVDITDRPEMPRPSRPLAAVQRATYLGRDAARAERLGLFQLAAHRWRQCAREWTIAGDTVRAGQADGYRRQLRRHPDGAARRIIAPLVCDLVTSIDG